MKTPRHFSGFSLIELSIVLVILGLLVGGILAGQSLIRAAELRSVSADYAKYTSATHAFRDKYFGLPGDIRNATSIWGDDNAVCPDSNTNGTPGTCNGDASGFLGVAAGGNATGEIYRFWQQLALAGLIEGIYTGLSGSVGGIDHDFGVNSPRTKIPNGGFGFGNTDNTNAASTWLFNYNYRNAMQVGADVDGSTADNPLFTPEEAWGIDRKMDDGMPGTGKLHAMAATMCTDAASASDRAASYRTSWTGARCSLVYFFMN